MRYLVRARVKDGCQRELLEAIERGTLGEGSVAEGEYLRNMNEARVCAVNSLQTHALRGLCNRQDRQLTGFLRAPAA